MTKKSVIPFEVEKFGSDVCHIFTTFPGPGDKPLCGGKWGRGSIDPDNTVLTCDRWCSRCVKKFGREPKGHTYEEAKAIWDAALHPDRDYITREDFATLRAIRAGGELKEAA
jgi:hypothetical protein